MDKLTNPYDSFWKLFDEDTKKKNERMVARMKTARRVTVAETQAIFHRFELL